jgi:hypothetical protein
MHEIPVSRHVNDADRFATIQSKVGKTEVDGYAPAFFVLVGVAVGPGKRFDEGCFAVVDVTGSAHDEMFHILFNGNSRPYPLSRGTFTSSLALLLAKEKGARRAG